MSALLSLLLACGGAPEAAGPAPSEPAHVEGAAGHGDPAAHGDHAASHHAFDDVDKWVKVFDDPARDEWQKPDLVIAAAALSPGMTVADIGAGTGYFSVRLAPEVGATGKVIAADVEPKLVAHLAKRATEAALPQIEARQIPLDGPGLNPAEVDRVLIVDTYHHIDGRLAWFAALKPAFKPGGKLVIVDFLPGELPVGPPPDGKIPPEQVKDELIKAGYAIESEPTGLPYQFVQVWTVQP